MITAASIRRRLREHADPARAAALRRFFKTGKGEYGEGDRFLGLTLPVVRQVCRESRGASLQTIETLLHSPLHEERGVGLMILVDAFKQADVPGRRAIYDFYLANTARVNNWDLVDSSAAQIVGAWLHGRSRAPLRRLARSRLLWDRRIAIISTHYFIRNGEVADTFAIAEMLLRDREDLIHKAVGWMLREAEKRDPAAARAFLDRHAAAMPRTMLRYAIERFPPEERRRYMEKPRQRQP